MAEATAPPPPKNPALNREIEDIEFLAYEGGAAFGLAYPSAMHCIEKAFEKVPEKQRQMNTGMGFKWPIRGVSGTSIGAIFAYLTALGYSAEEVTELAVRDGLFSKVFDEKFEYGRIMAAANLEGKGKVRLGWYGDFRVHRKDDWCLNADLEATNDAGTTEKDKSDFGEWLGKVLDADIMDLLQAQGLINPITLLLDPMFKLIGFPESDDSLRKLLAKFSIEVGVDALLKVAGSPEIELRWETARRLSDEITNSINKKLKERFWMIEEALGGTPVARVGGHLPIFAILLLLVRIDKWTDPDSRLWRGKLKRGQPTDFLNREKLSDIQWAEVEEWVKRQEGDGVSRTRSPFWYQIGLLIKAIWKNQKSDPMVLKHWRKLVLMQAKLGRILIGDVEGAEKFSNDVILELLLFAWSLVHSPITHTAWKSLMEDGGLLNGQKVRDLLTYSAFNKCAILPADDKPGGWRIVRRPETLVQTLTQLSNTGASSDAFAYQTKFGSTFGGAQHLGLSGKVRQPDRFRMIDADLFYALDCALIALEQSAVVDQGKGDREQIREEWERITATMTSLTAYVKAYTSQSLEGFGKRGLPKTISVPHQFRIIEEELTFERFYDAFGVDLVCTSANYTTSSACYWRRSLTPDFPVVEAARTAGAFPALFKPTAIAYKPADSAKGFGSRQDQSPQADGGAYEYPSRDDCASPDAISQWGMSEYSVRQWFYETHYRGYFADAGIFNNLPIHAFNGMLPANAGLPADMIDPAEFHMPHESLQKPLNPATLGIELSNENLSRYLTDDRFYRPPSNPFRNGYTQRKGLKTTLNNAHRSFGGVIGGILNALYAMSGKFRRLDPRVDRAVLQVIHGNIAMWDMIPNMPAIRDCYAFNIRRATYALECNELTEGEINPEIVKLVGPLKNDPWKAEAKQRLKMSGLDHVI